MRSEEEVFGEAMVWSKVHMRSRRGSRNGRKSREKRSHSTTGGKGNGGVVVMYVSIRIGIPSLFQVLSF